MLNTHGAGIHDDIGDFDVIVLNIVQYARNMAGPINEKD